MPLQLMGRRGTSTYTKPRESSLLPTFIQHSTFFLFYFHLWPAVRSVKGHPVRMNMQQNEFAIGSDPHPWSFGAGKGGGGGRELSHFATPKMLGLSLDR